MEVFVDVDVCVMTSRKELFPMTMVESCIAGVPLVLADTIEVSSLVANQAALVTPLEPKAIAAAIDRLLENEDLRKQFGHAGQRIAKETFSIKKVVDRLEEIYVDAINGINRQIPTRTTMGTKANPWKPSSASSAPTSKSLN